MKSYFEVAKRYAEDVVSGAKIAGAEVIMAAKRFLENLRRDDIEMHTCDPDFVINIVEATMVHRQGESLDGTPLTGKPLTFEPWQVFIVYNIVGFYYKGRNERMYKEAFIMLGRKNGKTTMAAALAWGLSLLERQSGSSMYIVAASMAQACQSFDFMLNSLEATGASAQLPIHNSQNEHSIFRKFDNGKGGSLRIQALASNPDAQDSFNCNLAIADEIHAFKKAAQYNRFKEAEKAYTNKLIIGITTAGDNSSSFCYQRMEYGVKVVNGTVADDSLFVFIARADQDENGDVDYTNPVQHEKANPNYGVTIRPADMLQESLQAQNDPQQRKDFLSRSLNVYTSAIKAYFDIEEFQQSDRAYDWNLCGLAKMEIDWYGGADLSKMHDLTAAALYGHDKKSGVDIIITHAFFPVTAAYKKADEDNIPLFGWQDDGWLTMCNSPTVNYSDIINWFVEMRNMGFRIRRVGFDKKFGREFFEGMRAAKFAIEDAPQYYYKKSEGFRHIEKAAKDGKLYYLHSDAYEYCVSNVSAVEKTDDMIQYEKVNKTQRIDLFDASVFACGKYLEQQERAKSAKSWFGEG